jgi:hypothetical protein
MSGNYLYLWFVSAALRLAHSLVHWLRRWYELRDVQVARARELAHRVCFP